MGRHGAGTVEGFPKSSFLYFAVIRASGILRIDPARRQLWKTPGEIESVVFSFVCFVFYVILGLVDDPGSVPDVP